MNERAEEDLSDKAIGRNPLFSLDKREFIKIASNRRSSESGLEVQIHHPPLLLTNMGH